MNDAESIVKRTLSQSQPSQPKYIKNLTNQERRAFLDSFDLVFCDCDGVIWQTLREGIAGADEAIKYLRQQNKQVKYVTNNSITPIEEQLSKFERCNITVDKRDIVHPAQAVCDHLTSIGFEGLIFCIASTPFKKVLRDAGFQLVEEKDRIINESVHELREAIFSNDPVKAVVIDVDFNMTAAKLMRAHVHLKDPECLFIGGAADTIIPFAGGDIIGPGSFIQVVEKSTKRTATILGKPGTQLCKLLKERYNLDDASRALFIGDSLSSDVLFGKMCGFQTLVVLTGGTKESDLMEPLAADETPDFVAQSIADIAGLA